MAMPSRVARITSSSPFVIFTSISSSSASMLMAFTPTTRTCRYAESGVFLTTPSRDANIR